MGLRWGTRVRTTPSLDLMTNAVTATVGDDDGSGGGGGERVMKQRAAY